MSYGRSMGDNMKRVKSIVQVTSALLIMTGIIHTTMVIKNVAPNFPAEILQSGAYVLMVLGTLAFIAMSKKSLRDVGLLRVHFVRQLIVGGVIGGILLVVCGAIYGTLRTLFEKTEKEIGIVSLSIAHWLFNVVL